MGGKNKWLHFLKTHLNLKFTSKVNNLLAKLKKISDVFYTAFNTAAIYYL